jgi:acyl-CoA thioester hydrolase
MINHRSEFRVIYGDTDNMGMAYYANYLRWFEAGRTELFRSLGLTYRAIEEKGIFLPVAEAHCRYLAPARYDDLLVVETSLDDGQRAVIKLDYRIFRKQDDRLLAEGYTKHACMAADGKVVRPPAYLRRLLAG